MKKIFLILFLLFSLNAYGACKKGVEVTGKNGHVYCASNVSMNWYTAFAWCDAQGRTLATMEQICDIDETQYWDGNIGEGECLNMVGLGSAQYVWSSTSYSSSHAFDVNLSNGTVNTYPHISMINALWW